MTKRPEAFHFQWQLEIWGDMTRAEFFMQMLGLYFYHVVLGSSTHSEVQNPALSIWKLNMLATNIKYFGQVDLFSSVMCYI